MTRCIASAYIETAFLKDDTELFMQFMDNESFGKWLTGMVFARTYAGIEVVPGPEGL